MYPPNFKEFAENCLRKKSYVGEGNPLSKILIIGKEVAINKDQGEFEKRNYLVYKRNAEYWLENINSNTTFHEIKEWNIEDYLKSELHPENNPLQPFKGTKLSQHKEGQTWRKYQKLSDLIFFNEINKEKDRVYEFHEKFFLSELNDFPSKTTKGADKRSLNDRKEMFKKSKFIQNFPIVILACSNYIWNFGNGENRQIDNIFKVKYKRKVESMKNQVFYVHFNDSNSKLVIHTRQLSSNTSNILLEKIAEEINNFKRKICLQHSAKRQ